jgi:hypothetical protein
MVIHVLAVPSQGVLSATSTPVGTGLTAQVPNQWMSLAGYRSGYHKAKWIEMEFQE